MEFRQLRAFVAVADELSFGQAARQCGTTQSQVSRLVRDLEVRLGVVLVLRGRGRRQVQLTEAGLAFAARARQVLALLDQAERDARGDAEPGEFEFRVGLSAYGRYGPWQEVIRDIKARHPGAHIVWDERPASADHAAALLDGRLDAAFIAPYGFEGRLGLRVIWTTHCVALLPDDHPLAQLEELPLAALRDELLYPVDPGLNRGLYGHIDRLTRSVGYELRVAPGVHGFSSLLSKLHLVTLNRWVLLGLPEFQVDLPEGVVARPIVTPCVPFEIAVAWNENNRHPVLLDDKVFHQASLGLLDAGRDDA
ncbi:LysR family transcriptional regulator [Deinococcus pimensis]|uniref:LysR family transcriptional regulator n=1 Tax=Deinococcus pimensis TaxID=309888 RepID=UPI00047F59D0|nr:LysR family transcriptional regulator [Deinococcus pimensis]